MNGSAKVTRHASTVLDVDLVTSQSASIALGGMLAARAARRAVAWRPMAECLALRRGRCGGPVGGRAGAEHHECQECPACPASHAQRLRGKRSRTHRSPRKAAWNRTAPQPSSPAQGEAVTELRATEGDSPWETLIRLLLLQKVVPYRQARPR